MKTSDKPEMVSSKAHVPKLLLTQALAFQKHSNGRNAAPGAHLTSLDSVGVDPLNSLTLNTPQNDMFVSHDNPLMKQTFDSNRAQVEAARMFASQEDAGENDKKRDLSHLIDSPNKKMNPMAFDLDSTNNEQHQEVTAPGERDVDAAAEVVAIASVASAEEAEVKDIE